MHKLTSTTSILFGFACWHLSACAAEPEPPTFTAIYSSEAVKIDGKLEDACWLEAEAYPLLLPKDRNSGNATPIEIGTVRLAWDEQFFYAAFEFTDSDVVADGEADQLLQHQLGDVAEIFLKPEQEPYYWEFHVTPRGHKSNFFFPSKGRLGLPSSFTYQCDTVAAARVDGTLNNWKDTDQNWTAEIAIPVEALTEHGAEFDSKSKWRVLSGRYNYSQKLPAKELSAAPLLPITSYHNLSEYARLELQKP